MVLRQDFSVKNRDNTLRDLIVNGLRDWEYKESREGRLWSSDSALCELKGVYKSNYEGQEFNDELKAFYTKSGIATEEVVLEGLELSNALLFDQYKLPPIGINIGGYIDGIIHYKDRIYVLEVKEIGTLPTSPIPSHESQTLTYSAITGLPAIIAYIDRNFSGYPRELKMESYELDCSYDNRYKYMIRATRAHLYNKDNVIPETPEYMKKSYCSYCPLYDYCWSRTSQMDITKDLTGDWKHATIHDRIRVEKQAQKIVEQILNKDIMLDRFKGVMKFLEKESRHSITQTLLNNQDWDKYFYYE